MPPAGLTVCGFISVCSTEQAEIKTSTPPLPSHSSLCPLCSQVARSEAGGE